jgi:hypothetical protein
MTRSPDLLLRSIGPSGRSYDRPRRLPPLAQAEAIRLLTAPPNHPVIIAPGSTPMGPNFLSPGWLRADPISDELRLQPRLQKLVEGTA